jgi:hypothetical protein
LIFYTRYYVIWGNLMSAKKTNGHYRARLWRIGGEAISRLGELRNGSLIKFAIFYHCMGFAF